MKKLLSLALLLLVSSIGVAQIKLDVKASLNNVMRYGSGTERNNNLEYGKEYFEKSVSNVSSLGLMGMDFEVINEIKEGDKATIEIRSKDQSTSELYSIKEDGVWKLDYARTIEESMKKVE